MRWACPPAVGSSAEGSQPDLKESRGPRGDVKGGATRLPKGGSRGAWQQIVIEPLNGNKIQGWQAAASGVQNFALMCGSSGKNSSTICWEHHGVRRGERQVRTGARAPAPQSANSALWGPHPSRPPCVRRRLARIRCRAAGGLARVLTRRPRRMERRRPAGPRSAPARAPASPARAWDNPPTSTLTSRSESSLRSEPARQPAYHSSSRA